MPPEGPKAASPPPPGGWLGRARALVAANNFPAALDAWQAALDEAPQSLDVVAGLADTAFRLNLWELAEKFHAHLITEGRQDTLTVTTYAACLREQGRFDEAIDLLKTLAGERPNESALWEGLGAALLAKGDRDTACIFLDEALRLDAGNLNALFHRGCALMERGDVTLGLADVADCARRFRDPANRASAELTCAHAALGIGDLASGWAWYEARHMKGTAREVAYELALPRISVAEIGGKRLFVSAEQGLGDEVLFGSVLPDIAAETAYLGIGVEPRLVSLFQRSFPAATVVAHHTETRDGLRHRAFIGLNEADFDGWALMGDFLALRRATITDFTGKPFLMPDPERVAYWRARLGELGTAPKIGVLWKSLISTPLRDKSFSRFEQWRDILTTSDVIFVNLQYGDTQDDMAIARAAGLNIQTLDGIDLKNDLDDLAALSMALDLIIGPSNATTNIAAACGATVWIVAPPLPWLALGQANYPWYGSVRTFVADIWGEWASVMTAVATALADVANESPRPSA